MGQDDLKLMNLPRFPREYRASGLLLHITSLPSPYGLSPPPLSTTMPSSGISMDCWTGSGLTAAARARNCGTRSKSFARLPQAHWLEDCALFRALKERHNGVYY